MSTARKTLKILSFVYVLLGVVNIFIGVTGIGGNGDFIILQTSNVLPAAIVIIARGVIDLVAAVFGIRAANKPSQIGSAFALGIIAAVASIAQFAISLPALGGANFEITDIVLIVYDLFFVQQAMAIKKENKDRL